MSVRRGFVRRAAALVLLGSLGIFAAPPAGARAARQASTTAPGAAAPAAAPAVRIPFPADDGSLTPYTFEIGYPLMTLVYDTLFWRDRDGVPQPWLARSAETSADGKTVTLRLADNATWHDGAPVTSADVAFTFRFMHDRPHPRFTPELEAIARVDTPDDSTVVVTLKHPSLGFLDQPLSDVPIIPAHIWQSLPSDQLAPPGLPVGSGPYRMTDHQVGVSYRFEANTSYFRGPPQAAVIEVPIIDDAERTFQAFEHGDVDMVPLRLSKDLVTRLKGAGGRIAQGPSYQGTTLVFNVRQPPFDRVEVRRAVAKALDLDQLRLVIGDAVSADKGYLDPDSPWASSASLHTYDESAARSEVARLGVPPFDVMSPANDPTTSEAGRQVALALSRVGLRANFKAAPDADVGKAMGADGGTPSFGVAIATSPALASYDPDYLGHVFANGPDAPLNYSGWVSPAFDAAASRIASAPDTTQRHAAVQDALKLVADEAPVVPLLFPDGQFAFRAARYDKWVFVKGTGILDKLSFLDSGPGAASASPTSATPAPGAAAPPHAGSGASGFPLLGVLAAVLILGAVAGGIVLALRR